MRHSSFLLLITKLANYTYNQERGTEICVLGINQQFQLTDNRPDFLLEKLNLKELSQVKQRT